MAGEVLVGRTERRAEKPGELVDAAEVLAVSERPRFASRGGIKLENGLAATGLTVAGRRALGGGASTGGFTDCLGRRGGRGGVAGGGGLGRRARGLARGPRLHG